MQRDTTEHQQKADYSFVQESGILLQFLERVQHFSHKRVLNINVNLDDVLVSGSEWPVASVLHLVKTAEYIQCNCTATGALCSFIYQVKSRDRDKTTRKAYLMNRKYIKR